MIGLCIKYFHENYGGMLQAFATINIIEKRNIEYELIRYGKKKKFVEKVKNVPRIFNKILLNDKYEMLKKKAGKISHPEFKKNDSIRLREFKKFNEKYFVKLSEVYETYDDLKQGSKNYNAVITGSDQLWSPAGLPTNFYNLQFVESGIRKISYASSFGVSKIPWYQKSKTKDFLEKIDYISVREDAGKRIIKELTGMEVQVVLDPVMMLDKEEWDRLIPNEKIIGEKYIFAYFLGSNREHREAAKEIARKCNLKIVTLRHMDQYVEADNNFGDYSPYDIGPDKFLNLIRNAEMVLTDSYHGTCFSIINEKKFIVFNRYSNKQKHSKNSRIDTLCREFGLENRRYSGEVDHIINQNISYDKVKEKLGILKQESEQYLDMALKDVE